MFFTIIKTAFRNISSYRLNSIINIGGLTVGFTAFILIGLFVKYEYSWDKNHINYDRIYRLQQIIDKKGEVWTQTPAAISYNLQQKYPEIEKAVIYMETWGQFIRSNERNQINEPYGAYTDSTFFDIFTFKFLLGNSKTSLNSPQSIILVKKLADKLFPKVNPLGKLVTIDKKYTFVVTGVYDNLPQNCTLTPSYFLSLDAFEKISVYKNFRMDWESSAFRTYVLLKPGTDASKLNKKIANLYRDNDRKQEYTLFLYPLSLCYLRPELKIEYEAALFTYLVIAIFMLTLVSINYINFTVANTAVRANEIAVRKVNGSSKLNLACQFLTESLLTMFISVVMAFILAELVLPVFNRIVSKELSYVFPGNVRFFLLIFFVSMGVGFMASVYPALYLASLNSYELLHRKLFRSSQSLLRKCLVTFQFTISLFLIMGSIVMAQQLNFMLRKDLGFNKENILFTVLKSSNKAGSYEDFRNRILKNLIITDACLSRNIPFYWSDGSIVNWEGGLPGDRVDLRTNQVNYDFIRVMGMKIIVGRDFSRKFRSDSAKSCIINQTAVRLFGWKQPLGKTINNGRWQVIGVVKDFHPYSVHQKIPPFLLELHPGNTGEVWIYSFKIAPGKMQDAQKYLTAEFNQFFPKDPFEFRSLNSNYLQDETFVTYGTIRNTFFFFTVLTILLTVFGLLGLVSFTTQRRVKEIGIRKINGSTIWDIYLLLNKDYFVLIAFAAPVAILANIYLYPFLPYNYRYGLHSDIFILAIFLLVFIALATTAFFTYKASVRNPSETLRNE